jgi:predicted metal-binding membrane protein
MQMEGHRLFLVCIGLGFLASSALTVAWTASMSTMPGMEMTGTWTMSMTWMRMPDQSWSGMAMAFIGMWDVMMMAMMLPAMAPMVMRYRVALGDSARRGGLTLRVIAGYFLVWTAAGGLVLAPGVLLGDMMMHLPELARAVPLVSSSVIMAAGAVQLSSWKARRLQACCQTPGSCGPSLANERSAWRHGIDLGLRCVVCCAPLTVVLLVLGVMDLLSMLLVTIAITVERLAWRGALAARVVGMGMLLLGLARGLQACSP